MFTHLDAGRFRGSPCRTVWAAACSCGRLHVGRCGRDGQRQQSRSSRGRSRDQDHSRTKDHATRGGRPRRRAAGRSAGAGGASPAAPGRGRAGTAPTARPGGIPGHAGAARVSPYVDYGPPPVQYAYNPEPPTNYGYGCDISWMNCGLGWGSGFYPGFYPANVVVVRAPNFRRFHPGHGGPRFDGGNRFDGGKGFGLVQPLRPPGGGRRR